MSEIEIEENLWGYRKRLCFVRDSIETAFPNRMPSELHVLDVGCGSAFQLGLPLARHGYQLTGIDTHEPSIELARKLANGLPNTSFVCARVEDLRTNAFDVVILSEVLEHVTKPEKLLAASVQHMKDTGIAIVTVPNGYGEFEWDSWFFRGVGLEYAVEKYIARQKRNGKNGEIIASTENHDDRHIQFFTLGRLHAMFATAELRVENEMPSVLFAGPFAGHTLARIPSFFNWNARIADRLPMWAASGWYFALRRENGGRG